MSIRDSPRSRQLKMKSKRHRKALVKARRIACQEAYKSKYETRFDDIHSAHKARSKATERSINKLRKV